jgi:hypothetical protein
MHHAPLNKYVRLYFWNDHNNKHHAHSACNQCKEIYLILTLLIVFHVHRDICLAQWLMNIWTGMHADEYML